MVLEWLEKSIQGTSGALRGFGGAGVVLARAAGHGSASAASNEQTGQLRAHLMVHSVSVQRAAPWLRQSSV